jgi:hypothetical protein
MLKRSITYINPITEQQVTEEHYFHISKAQLIDLQLTNQNEPPVPDPDTGAMLEGYAAKMQRIVNTKDNLGVVELLKDFIRQSYGKKDGERFLRSPQITADFEASEAFSQLYFELCTDGDKQNEFINGVLPNELQEEVNKIVAAQAARSEDRDKVAERDPTGFTEPTPESNRAPETSAMQKATNVFDSPGNPHDDEAARRLNDPSNVRILTQTDLVHMDSHDLQSGLASGRYKLSS